MNGFVVGSNEHGRLLELVIAERLKDLCASMKIPCRFSIKALAANARDKEYLVAGALGDGEIADFVSCAGTFSKWIEDECWLFGASSVVIHRFTDEAGKKSDTSDMALVISKGGKEITRKISVKHHHDALKHPRLPSIPDHLGVKDSREKAAYRAAYKKIWEEFVSEARRTAKNKTKFTDLKAINPEYVEKNLYLKLNNLVVAILKKHGGDKNAARSFFSYLVSGNDFIAVKNEKKQVLIKHFENIKKPNSMLGIKYPYERRKTTFFIEFDNNWQITFRLHTASSEFYRKGKAFLTEKLDVICINLEDVIEIERLPKA